MSPQQAKKLVMMMVEQGILCQQTVKSVQCVGVPTIFGLSKPAKQEVVLTLVWTCASHRVSDVLGHCRLVCAVHKLVSTAADVDAACAKANDA